MSHDPSRSDIHAWGRLAEPDVVRRLIEATGLTDAQRLAISANAEALVTAVRARPTTGLVEPFLAEYGLNTEEGVALMGLAEALLRIPDTSTVNAIIGDKIGSGDWRAHAGGSGSRLVNFSSWGLGVTARLVGSTPEQSSMIETIARRLGEPVIRLAVAQAIRMMGDEFVLGQTIDEALKKGAAAESLGYRHSFDMLGEAAKTEVDAQRYLAAYAAAISRLALSSGNAAVRENPGISVKLSALHPRYEFAQRNRVMSELVDRTLQLARAARAANIGFNIDAEEAERLELSLDVISAVLADQSLAGWDGFGVVVQAYGKRVLPVIDWLDDLAACLNRRIMVRLVKGAYWDAEIKRAQVLGLDGFPVLTRKAETDVSYIAAARRLLGKTHIYPQFATHNAHSAAAVLFLAGQHDRRPDSYEFQRLHGMGESLHETLRSQYGTRTRIYAPVGPHKDLLAYLVRRLLENGANSSFVHKIADPDVPVADVAADPISKLMLKGIDSPNPAVVLPKDIFAGVRENSRGYDLTDAETVGALLTARETWRTATWNATSLTAGYSETGKIVPAHNPAARDDIVGSITNAAPGEVEVAIASASAAASDWAQRPHANRAALLRSVAAAYEANTPELLALLSREAGKTLADAVAEIREAVDFLFYYAAEAERTSSPPGRRVFAAISPWNFPLAIFTGQIAAALVAGNAVVAKPAEQTPIIGFRAVQLMHEAGIPTNVLHLVLGAGEVGARLTADPRVGGVVFTGSLETAQAINRSMARHLSPDAPLVAETGGLNAMIVDSTALLEQATRDIITSAFQSAGQRCSALRILYVQEEIADDLIAMVAGGMRELRIGDPWSLSTDVGPVIEPAAQDDIQRYIDAFARKNAILAQLSPPAGGHFVGPSMLRVSGIADLEREVFGPVLHVATFRADDLDGVVDAINASGYGLTFGLHSRIQSRIARVAERIHAGNVYVNRNQIGAVVGSQPFGGEGLSGTGPKAGGPNYLPRFAGRSDSSRQSLGRSVLPGPTGESNILTVHSRATLHCLGPTLNDVNRQTELARDMGLRAIVAPSGFDPASLVDLPDLDAVAFFGDEERARSIRLALAAREGKLIPLLESSADADRLIVEHHVCIDTTAAGGNALLVANADS